MPYLSITYLSLMYHLCITGFLKVIVEVLQYKYVLINRSVCIASGHPGVRSGNIRAVSYTHLTLPTILLV